MKKRGFTLIEMVVVLAVVATLAAILVPTIEKNINDAKKARASNEVQVIAAAMASFFKDVGRWPNTDGSSASLPANLELLYGPGSTGGGTNTQWWGTGLTNTDTFANHLIENDPGDAANDYPTTGEFAWRGPYINQINSDPWGYTYACNIQYTWDAGGANAVFVWSAGPDGEADTTWAQSRTSATLGDDDIGVRIR